VAELFFDVPIDYSKPNEGTLRLFARSVRRLNKPVEAPKEETKLPWLVYLQGGPGHGCGAPQNYGWVEPVLNKGYQVSETDTYAVSWKKNEMSFLFGYASCD
jgi:proline iminopeptidase